MQDNNIYLDVHTRIDPRSLRRTSRDIHDHFQRAGQDAGIDFGNQFATGFERSSARMQSAAGRATSSTDKLREAEQRYQQALRSGSREEAIDATNRLARAQRDAHSETSRLADAQRDLYNAVNGGGNSGPGGFMLLGRAIAGIASSGPASIAVVTALAGGIAQLVGIGASAAQSLWVLPGAVGALGTAFATVKLATSGMGDVFDNFGDPEKFAAALQKVSPAAGDFALSVKGSLPYLRELQQATQESFFAGTGPVLTGLMDQYLPEIQQLTTGIASAMNQSLAGMADQLLTPDTQASVHTFIDNVVLAFQNLGPALAPFTEALADIMAAGSGALPGLAQGLTNAANSFSAFINDAQASGELDQWISDGLTAVQQLGEAVWYLGETFVALIPTGQAVLPDIVSAFQTMAEVTPVVVDFIEDIAPAVDLFANAIRLAQGDFSVITDMVGTFGDFAVSIFDKVRDVLNAMFDPIREGIDLANRLPGINIPQIPDFSAPPGSAPSLPRSSLDGVHGTDPQSQILLGTNPTAGLPGSAARPDPFWGVPEPARWGNGGAFADRERQQYRESIGGGSSGSSSYGYTSDQALLSSIPAGRYLQTQAADLTQGIGDCTSSIEDLIAIIDGRSTAGRSLATGNAHEWLLQHGFQPGYMPGAFNVGFNEGHMQAELPGGTPFNWGSDSAAARRGIGGSGALDPSFTNHYYRAVDTGPLDNARPYSRSTPVTVDSFGSSATATMSDALGLDADLGLSRGLGGLVENLVKAIGIGALAPMTLQLQGGGFPPVAGPASTTFGPTPSMPAMPSFGPSLPFIPSTFTPGGANPLPGLFGAPSPTESAGMAAPASYAARQPGQGWQPQGGGFNGIQGLPMAAASSAISAAGMGADAMGAMGGGSAAAGAAQLVMQLANRAIGYGGQLAAIGVNGLFETFGMQDTTIGDPSQSWLGRIVSGFAGARPASANAAGNTEAPLKQEGELVDALRGATDAFSQTKGGNGVNIGQFVQAENRNGQQAAADLAFRAASSGLSH